MSFSCVIVLQCIVCEVPNVLLYTQVILLPPYCYSGGCQILHKSTG